MVRLPATRPGGASWPAKRSGPSPDSDPGRLRLSFRLDRFGEAVADPEHGFDVARADLLADVLDVSIDRPFVRLERHASHRVQQLRAGEHTAGLPRHQSDDL